METATDIDQLLAQAEARLARHRSAGRQRAALGILSDGDLHSAAYSDDPGRSLRAEFRIRDGRLDWPERYL